MVYKIVTAQAPVNIAVIKYWGKADEHLKIPLNDSISGTLSSNELSATTSAAISDKFKEDKLWLNGVEQILDDGSQAKRLIDEIRTIAANDDLAHHKVHIVSINNFPTAAGLASSAAGYACLSFVLGNLYGVTDSTKLSVLARKGSGSACRSIFGGFVQWHKGLDSDSSVAEQIVGSEFWPQMRVVICVVQDSKKDVSSSQGMSRSTATSEMIHFRARDVVPGRIRRIKEAILAKNFDDFAEITMQDSNQFHAICQDTWPPLFYMNETSRAIVEVCHLINNYYDRKVVAYTFDAGPNACIFLLDEHVDEFISVIQKFFPSSGELSVRGRQFAVVDVQSVSHYIESKGLAASPNSLKYLINTSIGNGPTICKSHIVSKYLEEPSE